MSHVSGKVIAVVLASVFGTYCLYNKSTEESDQFRVPAEFELQAGIWLASPTVNYKTDWSMLTTQVDMIQELIHSTNVYYAINQPEDSAKLNRALLAKGVNQSQIKEKIKFSKIEHGDLWMRDTGGIYMMNEDGAYQVVDFDFDAYRMKDFNNSSTNDAYQIANDASKRLAKAMNIPYTASTLVAEGGNFHFNGKGTVISIRKALVMSNPDLTESQIVAEIKRIFNVKKVILLPESLPTDSHPVLEAPYIINNLPHFNFGVWHVDEMVTWKDDHTVFLPEVSQEALSNGDPLALKAHEALEQAYAVLSKETTESGKPITIIRTPEPAYIPVTLRPGDLMYDLLHSLKGIKNFPTDGSPITFILAASYMNYVISNNVILIPKLFKPGRNPSLQTTDEAFRQIMETNFPNRRIVQIDIGALAAGGGGMHCITQQVPGKRP